MFNIRAAVNFDHFEIYHGRYTNHSKVSYGLNCNINIINKHQTQQVVPKNIAVRSGGGTWFELKDYNHPKHGFCYQFHPSRVPTHLDIVQNRVQMAAILRFKMAGT